MAKQHKISCVRSISTESSFPFLMIAISSFTQNIIGLWQSTDFHQEAIVCVVFEGPLSCKPNHYLLSYYLSSPALPSEMNNQSASISLFCQEKDNFLIRVFYHQKPTPIVINGHKRYKANEGSEMREENQENNGNSRTCFTI